MIYNILLFFLAFIEIEKPCEASEFEKYLDAFVQTEQPIIIDEKFMFNHDDLDVKNIDSELVHKFVVDSIYLLQPIEERPTYSGLHKFIISDSMIAVIVIEEEQAGGISENYYLITYDLKGNRIDKLLISNYVADCAFKRLTTSIINNQKILLMHHEFSGSCDNYNYKLIDFSFESYTMKDDGSLVRNSDE